MESKRILTCPNLTGSVHGNPTSFSTFLISFNASFSFSPNVFNEIADTEILDKYPLTGNINLAVGPMTRLL